jgi:DNA mismatch repair protein MutS2
LAEEYNSLKDFLEQQQKRILKEAKTTAQQLIKDANKNIEQTIRLIKETNADKEKTKEARQVLKSLDEQLKKEEAEAKPKLIKTSGEIKKGDSVIVDGQEEIVGEVVGLKGKEAQVVLGSLTTYIKLSRLIKVSKAKHRKQTRTAQPTKGLNLNDKRAEFSMDIDVRGQRVEEAVVTVDRFLDNAMMLSQSQVRILHGKGNGVLRSVIRDYIRQYNFVDRFENEHVEQGGDGITVVYLK